jgi:hypothetical protein
MKRLLIIIVFFIIGLSFNTEASTPRYDAQFGFFYSSLSPYGTWIEIDYGVTVWRPTIIKRGWIPYRHGRWIWTVDGWYWDSYEPFGYITFHYGRWYYDDYYGWIWIPDYEWAPAWVEWRYDNYYIGWAPLPPYAEFSISIGIHYTYDYYVPYHHWHFVKYNHFCDPYVYNYYVAPQYKYRIHSRTKYRTNYGYSDGRVVNRGVDINYVKERTGQDIRVRKIERISDPNEYERYRNNNNSRGSNDVVRTFVASREQISKDSGRNIRIEKFERRSSLETSKIRIGDRGIKDRNDEIRESNNNGTRIKKEEIIIRNGEGTTREMKKDIEKKNIPERSKNFGSGSRENNNTDNNVLKNRDVKRETKKETNRSFNSPKNNTENKQEVKREVKRETVKENRAPQKRNEARSDNKRNENRNNSERKRR